MKTIIKFILKFAIIVVVLVVLLLVTATVVLNTQSVQDDLVEYATEQLELKLGTHVKIDHASVNVFSQKVKLVWRLKTSSIGRCLNWVACWWRSI